MKVIARQQTVCEAATTRRSYPMLACLLLVAVIVALAACGRSEARAVCQAHDTLREAVRQVEAAGYALRREDRALAAEHIAETDRLIRAARTLASGRVGPDAAAAARAILEAANYLEFMTDQFRSGDRVDFSLTQFASRELTRALSGAGGAPLNC